VEIENIHMIIFLSYRNVTFKVIQNISFCFVYICEFFKQFNLLRKVEYFRLSTPLNYKNISYCPKQSTTHSSVHRSFACTVEISRVLLISLLSNSGISTLFWNFPFTMEDKTRKVQNNLICPSGSLLHNYCFSQVFCQKLELSISISLILPANRVFNSRIIINSTIRITKII